MHIWTIFGVARLGDDALLYTSNGVVWGADRVIHGFIWAENNMRLRPSPGPMDKTFTAWTAPAGITRRIRDGEIRPVCTDETVCIAEGTPAGDYKVFDHLVRTPGIYLKNLIYVSGEEPKRARESARVIEEALNVRVLAPDYVMPVGELYIDRPENEWVVDLRDLMIAFREGALSVWQKGSHEYQQVVDLLSMNEAFYKCLFERQMALQA